MYNMKYIRLAVFMLLGALFLSSCNDELQTEYGVSKIYFSNTTYTFQLKGIDTEALEVIKTHADTTFMVTGVYRSGVVDDLQEITLQLSIDSVNLDSIITKAQTAAASELTDLMKKYKNSKALGQSFFSIPETVTIPKGDRRVVVPVTIKRSMIELYKNDIFNYNAADLASTTIPKDKMLVLPVKITSVSGLTILETQQRYYFQVLKLGNLK